MRPWLLPLVAWQGQRVRRGSVVLPEAGGPHWGRREPAAADAAGRLSRLVVIGESTAAGVGVVTHEQGMAAVLAADMAEVTGRVVEWAAVGRSGATLRRIRHRLLPAIEAVPGGGGYDVIVLLAGVNDVLTRRSSDEWADDLVAVVGALVDRLAPEGRLVVSGTPAFADFPSLPWPLSAYLDELGCALDARSAQVCRADERVRWVPARDLLPAAGLDRRPGDADGWYAADGFHPGEAAYAAWARHLAAALADPR